MRAEPIWPAAKAVPLALKRAAAATVATQIQSFWSTRYPGDITQIRVTADPNTNTVFVQAAPEDLGEIRDMIEWIDNTWSASVNETRIIPLKNSLSDDIATILTKVLSDSTLLGTTTPGAAPGAPTPGRLPVHLRPACRPPHPPALKPSG